MGSRVGGRREGCDLELQGLALSGSFIKFLVITISSSYFYFAVLLQKCISNVVPFWHLWIKDSSRCVPDVPVCMHTCLFNSIVLPDISIEQCLSGGIILRSFITRPFTFCQLTFSKSLELFSFCVGRRFHLLVPRSLELVFLISSQLFIHLS